jgi:hypothetical protein
VSAMSLLSFAVFPLFRYPHVCKSFGVAHRWATSNEGMGSRFAMAHISNLTSGHHPANLRSPTITC